jgi:hypothetical protein
VPIALTFLEDARMYLQHDTKPTEPFNPHGCPICVAILRLPHRGGFPDWQWTQCRCRYSLRRYRCGHAVYLDLDRCDKNLEEHVCAEPVNPWRVQLEDIYPEPNAKPSPTAARRMARGR